MNNMEIFCTVLYLIVLLSLFNTLYDFYKRLIEANKQIRLSNTYIRRLKASAKMRGVDLEDVFDDRRE